MTISQTEALPLATAIDVSDDELIVSLADGRRISVPLAWFPRLLNASKDERAEFRFLGGGEGIHWPRIDEDISVAGLLRGVRAAPHSTIQYRRSEDGDAWHWCRKCSSYPAVNFFVRRARPARDLCNECTAISKTDKC